MVRTALADQHILAKVLAVNHAHWQFAEAAEHSLVALQRMLEEQPILRARVPQLFPDAPGALPVARVVEARKKAGLGFGQESRRGMEPRSPARGGKPQVKVSGRVEPQRAGVLQEKPVNPALRFPAKGVQLRRAEALSGKNLPVHLHFPAAGAGIRTAHHPGRLDLSLRVQILKEHA